MTFKPLDNDLKVHKQELEKYNRKGLPLLNGADAKLNSKIIMYLTEFNNTVITKCDIIRVKVIIL